MDEGIGNSESAASTASSEAQGQWQAKIAAVVGLNLSRARIPSDTE